MEKHEHHFVWQLAPDEEGNNYESCTVEGCYVDRINGEIIDQRQFLNGDELFTTSSPASAEAETDEKL